MADKGIFELTIKGRAMRFHPSSEGQLMMLQRVLTRLESQFDASTDTKTRRDLAERIGKTILDIVETKFVDPEDRDWVEEQMLLGNIDIPDIMPVFANGAMKPKPAPDDAPPPVKKTPARKAPAKKTANASRAQR